MSYVLIDCDGRVKEITDQLSEDEVKKYKSTYNYIIYNQNYENISTLDIINKNFLVLKKLSSIIPQPRDITTARTIPTTTSVTPTARTIPTSTTIPTARTIPTSTTIPTARTTLTTPTLLTPTTTPTVSNIPTTTLPVIPISTTATDIIYKMSKTPPSPISPISEDVEMTISTTETETPMEIETQEPQEPTIIDTSQQLQSKLLSKFGSTLPPLQEESKSEGSESEESESEEKDFPTTTTPITVTPATPSQIISQERQKRLSEPLTPPIKKPKIERVEKKSEEYGRIIDYFLQKNNSYNKKKNEPTPPYTIFNLFNYDKDIIIDQQSHREKNVSIDITLINPYMLTKPKGVDDFYVLNNDIYLNAKYYNKSIPDKIKNNIEKIMKIKDNNTDENEIFKNILSKLEIEHWRDSEGDGFCLFHSVSLAYALNVSGYHYRNSMLYDFYREKLKKSNKYNEPIDFVQLINDLKCRTFEVGLLTPICEKERINIILLSVKSPKPLIYIPESGIKPLTIVIGHIGNHFIYYDKIFNNGNVIDQKFNISKFDKIPNEFLENKLIFWYIINILHLIRVVVDKYNIDIEFIPLIKLASVHKNKNEKININTNDLSLLQDQLTIYNPFSSMYNRRDVYEPMRYAVVFPGVNNLVITRLNKIQCEFIDMIIKKEKINMVIKKINEINIELKKEHETIYTNILEFIIIT